MFEKKVKDLLGNALEAHPSLFLIDFSIDSNYGIKVILDGDNGVTVEDCIAISRGIEHNLDREEQDFSLEVASCGAAAPLTLKRQYVKNLSRKLEVKLNSGETINGTLIQVLDDAIVLEWKAREPKPIGKGKVTVNKTKEIAFSDINKASVMIIFN
ncbi:MAG: ribosome assembly cofactor RimP [Flavobacteriaceae bacterium]|nr:ribosome assembly cofactor RimP [Flavobacteriaceae bacterium]